MIIDNSDLTPEQRKELQKEINLSEATLPYRHKYEFMTRRITKEVREKIKKLERNQKEK